MPAFAAPRLGRLDRVLLATASVLLLLTVLAALDPRVPLAIVHSRLDLTFHTVATIITGAVARLGYLRFRERGDTAGAFQAAGLVVLCGVNALNTVLILTEADVPLGFSLLSPGQLPLYVWAITRVVSAVLLMAGALVVVRVSLVGRRGTRLLVLGPLAGLGALSLALIVAAPRLPPLLPRAAFELLVPEGTSIRPLPELSAGLVALDGLAAVLLLMGAFLYRRRHRERPSTSDAYLSIGLVVAAFSQAHFVLYPAVFSGLVSTGDVLRVAFYGTLLVGLQAEAQQDLRALRTAYARVDRLRTSEVEAATLRERGRLAREIHDGLAQDLWSAKLHHLRLQELVAPTGEQQREFDRVTGALDDALREARGAVMTLRGEFGAGTASDELARYLSEIGERWGLRVDYAPDPSLGRLGPSDQAEVLRIAREAIVNVAKHADATVVRVTAESQEDTLELTIADNGRGFDPSGVAGRGVGLDGMRERAALLGGELLVRSEPGGGTTVVLRVPLTAPA
jgi:signal transduction histidine kinase